MCGPITSRLSTEVKEEPSSCEQKQQEPYILLSDSSEQVPVVIQRLCVFNCPLVIGNLSFIKQSDKEDANSEPSVKGTPKGRRKIRKIMDDENLRSETQEALREEEERCKRLADRDSQMEDRREVSEDSFTVTTKLILDQDEETKTPLVQVHRDLVTSLKPHQVDG